MSPADSSRSVCAAWQAKNGCCHIISPTRPCGNRASGGLHRQTYTVGIRKLILREHPLGRQNAPVNRWRTPAARIHNLNRSADVLGCKFSHPSHARHCADGAHARRAKWPEEAPRAGVPRCAISATSSARGPGLPTVRRKTAGSKDAAQSTRPYAYGRSRGSHLGLDRAFVAVVHADVFERMDPQNLLRRRASKLLIAD
jgi:hypothetical protein